MNATLEDGPAPTATPTEKRNDSKRSRSMLSIIVLSMVGLLVAAVIGYQVYEIRKLSEEVAILAPPTGSATWARTFANAAAPAAPHAPSGAPLDRKDLDLDRWDPRAELQRMQHEMNQLFGSSFSRFQTSPKFGSLFENRTFSPSIDVEETKDAYITRVDVPGANKANLNVEVRDNVLYIRGETKRDVNEDDSAGQVVRKERFEGRFERAIPLPSEVDPAKMTSEYDNGVLTITLPKKDSNADGSSDS